MKRRSCPCRGAAAPAEPYNTYAIGKDIISDGLSLIGTLAIAVGVFVAIMAWLSYGGESQKLFAVPILCSGVVSGVFAFGIARIITYLRIIASNTHGISAPTKAQEAD